MLLYSEQNVWRYASQYQPEITGNIYLEFEEDITYFTKETMVTTDGSSQVSGAVIYIID